MKKTNWLEVDIDGLRALVAGRNKIFVLHELIQNAWDTDTKNVEVLLESAPQVGRGIALLRVTDDDPRGFENLAHAYTLFADSCKKGDATKRGRFNLGEKLVLALCREATVSSTTGTIKFKSDGSRRASKECRAKGSQFSAKIAMTIPEVANISDEITRLIPPADILTTFNGKVIPQRIPVVTFKAALPTVIADEERVLRFNVRNTVVELYEPLGGEPATLYELGIPVVEIDCRWHINVMQKVPLNADRDNVTPAYHRTLSTFVLNHTSHLLTQDDAAAAWVGEALTDKRVAPEAVKRVVLERFGEHAVAFDPSDREANQRAAGHGNTVVGGGTFPREAWDNIRAAGALPAAGKLFPTPKPYDPDGDPVKVMPREEWTTAIVRAAVLTRTLAAELMGVELHVRIVNDLRAKFAACYGDGEFHYNYAKLGAGFFDDTEAMLDLIQHEFGHQYGGNHLADDYHKALTRLGAKMTMLALRKPEIFK